DDGGHIDNLKIGNQTIPTDQFGRVMGDYTARGGTYQTIPMIDVTEGRIAPEAFKDKNVLIGTPPLGLKDIVATPFEPVLAGGRLHANLIDNILHDRYLYRAAPQQSIDLAIILIFGAIVGYYLPKLNATRSILYTLLMLAAFGAFNYWTFIKLHWVLSA